MSSRVFFFFFKMVSGGFFIIFFFYVFFQLRLSCFLTYVVFDCNV